MLNKLVKLSRRIAKLQIEFARLKAEAGDEYVRTVNVKPTTVKRHTRRGYVARRIRK